MSRVIKAIGGAVGKVGDAFDKNFTSKDEKLGHLNESLGRNIDDRISAREMYKSDASLQKWYALAFLVMFVLVLGGMIGVIAYFTMNDVKAPDWAIAFFTTVFTAISMKIGTITDFLFGGSKTAELQERKRGR